MAHGPIPDLLPRRSKRARWAEYYLLDCPPTFFGSVEKQAAYWRIRRELQAEIEQYGYVRGAGEA